MMAASYESGLMSPGGLSQYLQDGGATTQHTSMGTPRPGTPRGNHFRLSPDGNLNPGTPGAASTHDHHGKFPNSPWSGSEPATPGSGYSRAAVVPNSPYISSYPNTPATPGGGGFYQKPGGITPSNGNGSASVPPGSPWTDRSVCTPGPMTPHTPATPMHSAMSDHGGGNNGTFGNNGSPTYSDIGNNGNNNNGKGKSMHNTPSLAALLQEGPTDSLLPIPVMNHSVPVNSAQQQPPNPVQNGNSGIVALASSLPQISESDITQVVDNNPNLISEFEEFFADFMSMKNRNHENSNVNHSTQQHQHNVPMQNVGTLQHNQSQQLVNTLGPLTMGNNSNAGMMYNMSINNGQQAIMLNTGHGHLNHINGGISVGGGGGPMRSKFISQNHHNAQHPYLTMSSNNGNGLMMRARQLPNHLAPAHNNQYGTVPQNIPVHNQHHPHQNMMSGIPANRPGGQFGLHHQQQSASVYAPPPSGNNGGYVQIQQTSQPSSHSNVASTNYQSLQTHHGGSAHWGQNNPQQTTQPVAHSQSNHGMMNTPGQSGVMTSNRNMTQTAQQAQVGPYFQNSPVNSSNDQGMSNACTGSVLPTTTYPFDLNGGSGGPTSNTTNLSITPGTGAMQSGPITPQQVPVQSPLSLGMGMPSTPQPNTPSTIVNDDVILDLDGPYDGSNISPHAWTKALDKCSRTNAVCEVAKVLFDEIFTDDEVIQCTFSGRGSTKKFNPNKVTYLKKATAWIMTRPQRPADFNMCAEVSLSPEDETGVKGVEKKVFTEYRSRRRGDILKARGQSGTGPATVS